MVSTVHMWRANTNVMVIQCTCIGGRRHVAGGVPPCPRAPLEDY